MYDHSNKQPFGNSNLFINKIDQLNISCNNIRADHLILYGDFSINIMQYNNDNNALELLCTRNSPALLALLTKPT